MLMLIMILKTNNNKNIDKMMMIIIMIVTAIIMRRAITNLLSIGLFDILKECNVSKGGKHSRLLSPQVLSEFQKLHKSVALLLFDEQNNWFVLFVPASSILYDTYSRLPPSINTCNRFQIFFRPPKRPPFWISFLFSPNSNKPISKRMTYIRYIYNITLCTYIQPYHAHDQKLL